MSADPTLAQAYWDTAAETYVQDFTGTGIGETRRHAVWRRLDKIFSPGQKLLELNCGTGIDAVHLAERGIQLVACDISSRMIELARQLAATTNTSELIDFRVLPNEEIGSIKGENVFDGAFSNFCGLNCVEDLPAVVRELTRLVKPESSGSPLYDRTLRPLGNCVVHGAWRAGESAAPASREQLSFLRLGDRMHPAPIGE